MSDNARQFVSDQRGSTAILFGLTFIPFLLIAGAAVDYSRAATAKGQLQKATDTVALSVAARLTQTSNPGSAKKMADALLQAQYLKQATVVGATVSPDKKKFCLETAVDVPTTIMKFARIDTMSSRSYACAEFSATGANYEVALVLDNSGSMNQSAGGVSKIDALKTAATNFVSTMHSRAPGKVKIAITPFSGLVVPVDPTVANNRTLPWIDVNGESSEHWITFGGKSDAQNAGFSSRFRIFNSLKSMHSDWDFGGCFEPQPYPMNVTETVPDSANADTLFVPFLAPDEPDSGSYPNDYLSDSIAACSSGSSNPWNKLARACKYKIGAVATDYGAFKGPNGVCPSAATQTVLQLTPSQGTLTNKIGQLSAGGDTNLHEGLMWGWRTISPNAPFASGSPYNAPNVKKIVVLMTDGYNNWSSTPNTVVGSWYEALGYYSYNGQRNERLPDGSRGNGVDYQSVLRNAANSWTNYFTTSRQAQDELTAQSCENAKKAGLEIFTIGFSVSTAPIDAAGLNLLKKCATDPDHYFTAKDAAEINSVFASIASNMEKLRLTQ